MAQNRKIDIYVGGVYVCSTTQRASLKEAKEKFLANPTYQGRRGDGSLGTVTADTAQGVTVQYAEK